MGHLPERRGAPRAPSEETWPILPWTPGPRFHGQQEKEQRRQKVSLSWFVCTVVEDDGDVMSGKA